MEEAGKWVGGVVVLAVLVVLVNGLLEAARRRSGGRIDPVASVAGFLAPNGGS